MYSMTYNEMDAKEKADRKKKQEDIGFRILKKTVRKKGSWKTDYLSVTLKDELIYQYFDKKTGTWEKLPLERDDTYID